MPTLLLSWPGTGTAQLAEPRAESDPDALIQSARDRFSPIVRCAPSAAGEIVVCGNDTQENRLSDELRAIAGVGQSTENGIPKAPEAKALHLDKLPYNWIGRDGILFPRVKPNPLLDHVNAMEAARAADAAAENVDAAGDLSPEE